jgi:lipoate-protein ligase B
MECYVLRMGQVKYKEALAIQENLVQLRRVGRIPEVLLLLQHPPVYTLGGGGNPGNLLISEEKLRELGIEFYHTQRGGDITYHGPGQIVGYPILDLKNFGRDAHKYLRLLEEVLIQTLSTLGIVAGRIKGLTGVWVGEEKVAAIGIRISHGWITSHGFALNVTTNLSYFNQIIPCGIRNKGVTSIARLLQQEIKIEQVEELILQQFEKIFHVKILESDYNTLISLR